MGESLADNHPDFLATGCEWRKQPLWCIVLIQTVNKHTFLLNEGRSRSIEKAILWHGGEAKNMNNKTVSLLLCILCNTILFGQNTYHLKGKIVDKDTKQPIPNAHIKIGKKYTHSNFNGEFNVTNLKDKDFTITISHVSYHAFNASISVEKNTNRVFTLKRNILALQEVIVKNDVKKETQKTAKNLLKVDNEFLEQNRGNSLMQTLKKSPGIGAISIGANQSKPIIRGLGFNRVVVIENGIKHEGQQWGAEHGLEIDQLNIEKVEIIKGASSLLYGSDAISGAINLKSNIIPSSEEFLGKLNLFGNSNNDLFGVFFKGEKKQKNWFYKFNISHKNYGDYKVPTDKIFYDNYIFDLHKNRLRNTAGNSTNGSISFGYFSDKISSSTTLSNTNEKNGFFANAHGLEVRNSTIHYDKNNRDIDLPFHKVNHFKLTNNTSFFFDKSLLKVEIGYQNNIREEHSEPVSHGYMPKPNSTKERVFNKNTYSINVQNRFLKYNNHKLTIGASAEFQQNAIDGWGFLVPEFNKFTAGGFVYDSYKVNENLFVEGGIRYDYGTINTSAYYDWFYSPSVDENGNPTQAKLQRAKERSLKFGSYSASLGISYIKDILSYKFSLGKGFRIPLAQELASDGVNYHMYRYEQGNINLNPESSYQLDAEFNLNLKKGGVILTPFINYFDNYIYLSPTSSYYETLQKYQYTQSKVLRYGGELVLQYKPFERLSLKSTLEYVKSRQLNGPKKNFALPFSPPLSSVNSVAYSLRSWFMFCNTKLFADLRLTATQEDIVPPEEQTQGYSLVNIGINTSITLFSEKHPLKVLVKVNNLFNRKVFDHTSFYRLIDVPEPGRNFSINLSQTF